MFVILALWRLRQKDFEFKPSLGYTVIPHLKKKKKTAEHDSSRLYLSYSRGREQEDCGPRPA
jgi:hypothetical protein